MQEIDRVSQLLRTDLKDLDLSVRAQNCSAPATYSVWPTSSSSTLIRSASSATR